MKTLTIDIQTIIKTSISLSDEEYENLEEFCKEKDRGKGEQVLKVISDGLRRSDRRLSDLVKDSGFEKELKNEVLKTLGDFLGTHNLSDYFREEQNKRFKLFKEAKNGEKQIKNK